MKSTKNEKKIEKEKRLEPLNYKELLKGGKTRENGRESLTSWGS